jgi:small subunit ribosomal protein S20
LQKKWLSFAGFHAILIGSDLGGGGDLFMPNIKSAIKRVEVTKKKNLRNRMVKSQLKTIEKKFEATLAAGDKNAAELAFRNATAAADKAASKGVIHKNAANRKKAQLAKKVASI